MLTAALRTRALVKETRKESLHGELMYLIFKKSEIFIFQMKTYFS